MKKIIFFVLLFCFLIFRNLSYSQDLTAEQIYERCNDAIVVVKAYNKSGQYLGHGSGIILSDKGLIVTNYHNYEKADSLKIFHFETEIPFFQVVGVDTEKDLLLLSTNYKSVNILPIANYNELKIGNKIYSLGSPLSYENSLTDGIISGLKRVLNDKSNLIQISSIINHGSSGGAVINSKGELIGISSYGKITENLFFAIPISEIISLKVVQTGDRSVEQFIYLTKAKMYVSEKDFSNAEYYYTKLISEKIVDKEILIDRGYCYLYNGKFNECKNDFEKALSLDINDSKIHSALGDYYFSINKFEQSELEYRKSCMLNPDDYYPIFRRGKIYEKLKSYDLAINLYNNALLKSPDNSIIIIQRSIANFLSDKIDNAFEDLNYILNLDPHNSEALLLKKEFTYLKEAQIKENQKIYSIISEAFFELGKIIKESFKKNKQ